MSNSTLSNNAVPPETTTPPKKHPGADVPFGANEVRLTGRQWLWTLGILLVIFLLTPMIWGGLQRFNAGPDYRLPYFLSNDYWLYNQRLKQAADPKRVIVLGDSVIWGEYVNQDGTLSHFLNKEEGVADRYVNAGVNGLYPLAMEGLLRYYGAPLNHQKVIVQCNVLWMTKANKDLSEPFNPKKPESINHTKLLPQFTDRPPTYEVDSSDRIGAVVERNVPFLGWSNHVQCAFFDQKSIPLWSLDKVVVTDKNGKEVSTYPNSYSNPFSRISLTVPAAAAVDPDRGPTSPRHVAWTTDKQATAFDWVSPEASLQVKAFQRTIQLLRERGNEVLVVVGPFNEHMVVEENRAKFHALRDYVANWLKAEKVPYVVPATLPTQLYADSSHPLTEGYAELAKQLRTDAAFKAFTGGR